MNLISFTNIISWDAEIFMVNIVSIKWFWYYFIILSMLFDVMYIFLNVNKRWYLLGFSIACLWNWMLCVLQLILRRMRSLIWIIAGRSCPEVRFLT